MSTLNTALIRESFDALKPYASEFATDFYRHLFDQHPEAKGLFESVSMEKQKKALIGALVHAVEFLNEQSHLKDYFQKMGRRHVDYGVTFQHYDWVGDSFMSVMAEYFNQHWTEELKEEWLKVLNFIATEMKAGAREKMKLDAVSDPEPSLDALAQDVAREALKQAMEKAVDEQLKTLAREKIKALLKETFEQESQKLLNAVRKDQAA